MNVRASNKLEFINEICVLIILYNLLLFSFTKKMYASVFVLGFCLRIQVVLTTSNMIVTIIRLCAVEIVVLIIH